MLNNSKQWEEELVIDYIQRRGDVSLNCKGQLSKTSAIEMRIQGMYWGSSSILQGIKTRYFKIGL